MQRDRFRLANELRKLEQLLAGSPVDSDGRVQALDNRIEESAVRCEQRRQNLPTVNLDESLPIFEHRQQILQAINDHQVIVISGETGSGKSTQLPLLALQAGRGVSGLIGHTQPRRIAARGVAHRISSQLDSTLGRAVGFKIRFDDQTSEQTYIKLMTDGILLAETQTDRFMDAYDLIIIDEAHERSLNIDFLFGRMKKILERRKELSLIITSATIDTQRFAEHFQREGGAQVPIIHVQGRSFPVEQRYIPIPPNQNNPDGDWLDHLVDTTLSIISSEQGDLLVFLPTENDIRRASRKIKGGIGSGSRVEVLPLYARLSTAQQNAIFQTGAHRRIVLATNVAESSITVPGIRIVVDSGTARISRYAPRSKVQRLPIEAISQASARQRAGRCGRIGPGICIRLYSEEDYETRPAFTTPEIRRTNLASVILQTLALRLGDIAEFPFIDPPHPDAIADGYRTLFEIGAIDAGRRLTRLGRDLAKLPIDPRLGRMIHAAAEEHCLPEILIIAAVLESQDPRMRPADKQQVADERQAQFRHEKSDFMSLLAVWDFFHRLKEDLSRSKFRLACQENFLSVNLLQQWQEIHRQLRRMVQQTGMKIGERRNDYDSIHRSLLAGLLSGVGHLSDRYEYLGAGGIKFHLWPGSGLSAARPKWIVAAEIVETARRYGRTAARIDPAWIEPLAPHLVKRQHVDPHWSSKRQTVMAHENVTLFGLPIVLRRRIGFGKIDPVLSRQLFIEQGLVEPGLQANFGFLEHNRDVLSGIERQAAKTRRRDLVIDSGLLLQHYQEQLPDHCFDTASLRSAITRDTALDDRLRLNPEQLLTDGGQAAGEFPDSVEIGSMSLPVEYRFEPGLESDGASVQIPQAGLGQITETQAGWLIPGLNESRIAAMIKSLPKNIRRNLVPVPETASTVASRIQPGNGSFALAVAKQLSLLAGESIAPDMFDAARIDEHLLVNLQIVDEQGIVLGQGRNVNELRKQFGNESQTFVETGDSRWNLTGLTTWDWDDLESEVTVRRGPAEIMVFPAVIDEGEGVGLKLVDSRALARHMTETGLLRLFAIALRKHLKRQVNWLPELDRHQLKLSWLLSTESLRKGLMDLITRIALIDGHAWPVSQNEFQNSVDIAHEPLSIATQQVAKWLPRFADAAQTARLAMESLPGKLSNVAADVALQMEDLAADHFLTNTPWRWLEHYPRYMTAIAVRCDKLQAGSSESDGKSVEMISEYRAEYMRLQTQFRNVAKFDPELEQLRWMIEEFRVSLFAQNLGTSMSISINRLARQIRRLENG